MISSRDVKAIPHIRRHRPRLHYSRGRPFNLPGSVFISLPHSGRRLHKVAGNSYRSIPNNISSNLVPRRAVRPTSLFPTMVRSSHRNSSRLCPGRTQFNISEHRRTTRSPMARRRDLWTPSRGSYANSMKGKAFQKPSRRFSLSTEPLPAVF